MGTRNLTLVKKNNKYPVAQYGQWDGYPSGQGLTVLNFLKSWNRDEFEKNLDKTSFITDEDAKEMNENLEKTGKEIEELYPALSRNTAAKVLQMIQDSPEGLKLSSSLNFAADSLFCEWAYLIDLDRNILGVYEGFNKEPLNESDHFYFLQNSKEAGDEKMGKDYFPVKLKASYSLSELPEQEEFLETEKNEEDEE